MLRDSVELSTAVSVEVHAASHVTTRGYSCPAVLCDELAFWSVEGSASPDSEIIGALRPAMATMPAGGLLIGLSTPYAARGELFKAWERGYARDELDDVLVWVAPSVTMNPSLDAGLVERAYADDPASAAAEYGAEFRRDVEAFLDAEAVRAVTVPGRRELAPVQGVQYRAFVDVSGGSVDSFVTAVAHREGERAILDAVREIRPAFSPDDAVRESAALLKSYHLAEVVGDRYGGLWPRERFQVHGIVYKTASRPKSDYYREALPLVNAGRVELLDLARLFAQACALERRVARGGKDSIDHPPGGRDDVANAALAVCVEMADAAPAATLARLGESEFVNLNTSLERENELAPDGLTSLKMDSVSDPADSWRAKG
jgi:hypothetical protein